MIYLDTHVIVWLYMNESSRFSSYAKRAINGNLCKISPIVGLELTYLHEIERLSATASEIIDFLVDAIELEICNIQFDKVINSTIQQNWTRDPFDRIIVGHAAVTESSIVTKDQLIRENYTHTIW